MLERKVIMVYLILIRLSHAPFPLCLLTDDILKNEHNISEISGFFRFFIKCTILNTNRIQAMLPVYHAGLSDKARSQALDDWSSGKVPVVVGTVAFGSVYQTCYLHEDMRNG